jgi:hypothetical protein
MYGKSISRRSLFASCAVIGLSGCAEDDATKIARDPYLPTMMQDPLYVWQPSGDVSRKEALLPRSTDTFASGTAVSRITITLRRAGNVQALQQEAETVSQQAGYVGGKRYLADGVDVLCDIKTLSDLTGIEVYLEAPA